MKGSDSMFNHLELLGYKCTNIENGIITYINKSEQTKIIINTHRKKGQKYNNDNKLINLNVDEIKSISRWLSSYKGV